MYSCCKPPNLGRKEKDIFEKRKQEFLEHEPECGVSRHRQFSKRIIGGEKAKFSELPWQVHIRISSYQCGGVLLNHWYIATAAHCVHRAKLSKITVHLGEYDTKDGEEEPLESQKYKVDHIIIHPDFRWRFLLEASSIYISDAVTMSWLSRARAKYSREWHRLLSSWGP